MTVEKIVELIEMFIRMLTTLENLDEMNKRRMIKQDLDYLETMIKTLKGL